MAIEILNTRCNLELLIEAMQNNDVDAVGNLSCMTTLEIDEPDFVIQYPALYEDIELALEADDDTTCIEMLRIAITTIDEMA